MKIGLTFDEQILKKKTLDQWLELTKSEGASFIELSPHPNILDLATYKAISKRSYELNLNLHFHVPYFADKLGYIYDWNIIHRQNRLQNYYDLLQWIDNIKDSDEGTYLIVHGKSFDANKINALDTTMRFTDKILNQIVKKNHNIKILYETLPKSTENSIGNDWEDLYSINKEFNSDYVKICWDICHDLRNHNFETSHIKDINFDIVPYAHLHGYNSNAQQDHVGLVFNKEKYINAIKLCKSAGFNGLINLEHLIYACGSTYDSTIIEDLKWTYQLITQIDLPKDR